MCGVKRSVGIGRFDSVGGSRGSDGCWSGGKENGERGNTGSVGGGRGTGVREGGDRGSGG